MSNTTAVWACYDVYTNRVPEQDITSWPCKEPTAEQPFVPCCASGSVCLSDNYCIGTLYNIEHYYIAGCTDPQFLDASCSTHCKFDFSKTVAFTPSAAEWTCCDTRNLTGSTPGNGGCSLPEDAERWSAPTPDELVTVSSLPATSPASLRTGTPSFASTALANSTAAVSSATVSSSSGNNSSNGSSNGNSHASGLSSGARVGIGVGIGLGLALLLVLIGLFLLGRRQKKHRDASLSQRRRLGETPTSATQLEMAGDSAANARVELEGPLAEMPANGMVSEMPGDLMR
jgi:hypothetical protein